MERTILLIGLRNSEFEHSVKNTLESIGFREILDLDMDLPLESLFANEESVLVVCHDSTAWARLQLSLLIDWVKERETVLDGVIVLSESGVRLNEFESQLSFATSELGVSFDWVVLEKGKSVELDHALRPFFSGTQSPMPQEKHHLSRGMDGKQ